MLTRSTWLVLVLATLTWSCESGPRPGPATPGPTPARQEELRAQMRVHFEAAGELQRAIAHGRLVEARDLAAWLARHYMDSLEGWQPYADELQIAARGVEVAPDVVAAGSQLGRLGRACSSCHETRGARIAFAETAEPADAPGLQAQMRRHQWAAARLWDGLIGPSDASWSAGARVMAATPLDLMVTAHAKPNVDVAELGERLRLQAAAAVDTMDRDVRATMYGDMMATCAGCHSIVRTGPVVDAR